MCLLDFLRTHVSSSFKFYSTSYTKYTTKSSSDSESDSNRKNLNFKQSLRYPEFMLLKNDDMETISTSIQEGSCCTDFIYASGKCENFHGVLNLDETTGEK